MPVVTFILLKNSLDVHHNLISLESDGDQGLILSNDLVSMYPKDGHDHKTHIRI